MSDSPLLYSHRPVDLSEFEAVGFDLDHTLALYDDRAVNELAAAAARRLLVEQLRYPEWLLRSGHPMEVPDAGRTLAADLGQGAVVKLDARRRVVLARRAGRWLDAAECVTHYAHPLDRGSDAVYAVHSPFELPVLWLLEEMEAGMPAGGARCGRCEDVRRMLDLAHTNGDLKRRIREDLPRFVAGIDGIARGLERWAGSGKRLFVVTNSERDYALAVLDRAVGPRWRALFDLVVTNARKPAFFEPGRRPARSDGASGGGAIVLEGADASRVEARLGARGGRVLFVGDNALTDIAAARGYGWRTAHVVPELSLNCAADGDDWGPALVHAGHPTWLARLVREHADIVCDRVDCLLAADPNSTLSPVDRR